MLDKMDEMKAEMEDIRAEIPSLQEKIVQLTAQVEEANRKTFAIQAYKAVDTDVTDALGFKFLVNKLSGFAKFDLDTKITKV